MCVKRPRHEGSDDLVPPGRMFSHVLGLVLSSPSSLRESFQPLDRQDVVIVDFLHLYAMGTSPREVGKSKNDPARSCHFARPS